MADIAENIETIQRKAAELDVLINQFRAAKAAIDAAETAIRRSRPFSDPSRAYQQRLALVALDAMGRPSVKGEATIAELALDAWKGVV